MQRGANDAVESRLYPRQRVLWALLSYGIAGGCLYWVFHDLQFSELARSFRAIIWWWILPAIILDLLSYVCAAWEWQLLLQPIGRLSLWQTTKAIFAGRFANDVLPVHAGYVIRVYLAARWLGRGLAAVIPSLLIERLFDGLWLAIGIGLVALFFPLPLQMARAGAVLGGVILAGALAVTWMIVRKKGEVPGQTAPAPTWGRPLRHLYFLFHDLENGIRSIGKSGLLLAALGLSVLKLVLQALSLIAVLQAYGFDFSVWVDLAVFMITYIGISLPSTPASLGVFQLFCVAGLCFFGVPKPIASSCALVAYLVLTAPLAIAGFVAVAQSGLTLRQVRQEIAQWKSNGPQRRE